MKKAVFFTVIKICFAVSALWAQDVEDINWSRWYDCRRAAGPITVDGSGDEFAWQLAPEVGEFTRFQNKDDLTVIHRTSVKMLWEDDYLYILAVVEDPDIWSTMKEGDKECLCREETVELFIDPDGDGKDYAEIHINCLDTINDLLLPKNDFKNHDGSDLDWAEVYNWTMEGMLHEVENYGTVNNKSNIDKGSSFEFALPWKGWGIVAGTANMPPKSGDIWRININRYERSRDGDKTVELSGWSPLKLLSYHEPERFGFVHFTDDF